MARHRFDRSEPAAALRLAPASTTRPDLADRPRRKSGGRGRFARGLLLKVEPGVRRAKRRPRRAPAPARTGSGAACSLLRRPAR